ncbi:hypothetical protein [Streptomyces cucumeris]|uniref:hypothetical protein n=1 Tax=Streptomyces cucumeris TaxID=2962890 RepID=UPI003D73F828
MAFAALAVRERFAVFSALVFLAVPADVRAALAGRSVVLAALAVEAAADFLAVAGVFFAAEAAVDFFAGFAFAVAFCAVVFLAVAVFGVVFLDVAAAFAADPADAVFVARPPPADFAVAGEPPRRELVGVVTGLTSTRDERRNLLPFSG